MARYFSVFTRFLRPEIQQILGMLRAGEAGLGAVGTWNQEAPHGPTVLTIADQRTGKNSGPVPVDYRNWASASPQLNYLREVILPLKGPLTWEEMVETSCKFRRLSL